jgi:hypothetical protein
MKMYKIKANIAGYMFLYLFLLAGKNMLFSQTTSFNGQITAWISSNPNRSVISQIGLRYIPDLFIEKALTNDIFLDADISLDMYTTADIHDWDISQWKNKFNAYRLWARLSTDRLETRLGLQKINFGSAVLFRPLQWFDRIDPRDPLKITDGVYGLLMRYYFQNNMNIWFWGLYGNDEPKGLELAPTAKNNIEFGGRIQMPLYTGEVGLTYHHREADFSQLSIPIPDSTVSSSVPENRLGLDGKWDIGVGLWFEGTLIQHKTDLDDLKYQRALTLGMDYTFDVGNGLTVIGEYFVSALANKAFENGEGKRFSGLSVNYPMGLVDNLAAILFYDWDNKDWYRTLTWQRIYDNWSFFLMGFWNPEELLFIQNQDRTGTFSGKGIHIMIVFNH